MQVGDVGYILVRDETGEMGKRQFCGYSYIMCNGVMESSCKIWGAMDRCHLSI